MSKKLIANILYGVAIVLLVANLFLKEENESVNIVFWLGLFIAAVAMLLQGATKKEEK